jgi:uncharacterized protein
MKHSFYARHALLILMVVFFFVPFGLRGARHALQGMKNDVRDWLPSKYDETDELNWFKDHFLGEQFVVVSWEGLHGDEEDRRFELFLKKLLPALPPSEQRAQLLADDAAPATVAPLDEGADAALPPTPNPLFDAVLTKAEVDIERPNFIGDQLGLYTTGNDYHNWGGQNEKWLRGAGNHWYYITPDGTLYRWSGVDAPLASLGRWVWRNTIGDQLDGEQVHAFGEVDGPWYHENPRRLRAQLFKMVTTGPGVYHSLVNEETGVLRNDPDLAKERLTGTLFGPDGEQTCIFLTLTEAAKRDLHQVLGRGWLGKPYGRLYETATECGIAETELRLGGPPVDNVAIDEEGTITLVRLVGLSVLLGLVLSYACFRSISATIMVFFVGGVSAVTSVALVWWLGSSMDAILLSMPSLVYVLGLSGSVHLMNYYHQALADGGPEGATERAVAHAWKPALLCNVTTAIGLLSLCTSEIIPIRKFGTFSAIGVLAMLVVVFTYLPAVLQIWPQKPKLRLEQIRDRDVSWLDKYLAGFWHVVGSFIVKHHVAVSISCTLFIAVMGYGVTRIQTSVNLLKMFDSSAKIISDYQWLEANLGRLVPMEVVVKVGKDSLITSEELNGDPTAADSALSLQARKAREIDNLARLNFLGRMELASRVQSAIEAEFGPGGDDTVGRAMSACTFAPTMPPASNDLSSFMERRATNKKLEEHRAEFLASDYLREDKGDGSELWRISVRLAASQKVDYGSFVSNLKGVVDPVFEGYRDRERVIRTAAELRFADNVKAGKVDPERIDRAVNPANMTVLVVGSHSSDESDRGVDHAALRHKTLLDMLKVARMKVDSKFDLKPEENRRYDLVVVSPEASQRDRAIAAAWSGHVLELEELHAASDPLAAAAAEPQVTQVSAVYTGVVPIVYKAQQALLTSLMESTKWSFLTITPLMMLVARSWRAGAVAMLPNALPVLVVFGAMGWMGVEVDVGSMMTASIALGVAVDDTIHYLSWFRTEFEACGDRKQAILRTYQRCATPTFQAAMISGLGLSIFAFSTFTPTQRFGYLMLTILWAGVASELIYFPALLAGPLGSVFAPAKKRSEEPAEEVAAEGSSADADSDSDLGSPVAASDVAESGTGVVTGTRVKPHVVRRDGAHTKRT